MKKLSQLKHDIELVEKLISLTNVLCFLGYDKPLNIKVTPESELDSELYLIEVNYCVENSMTKKPVNMSLRITRRLDFSVKNIDKDSFLDNYNTLAFYNELVKAGYLELDFYSRHAGKKYK